MTMTRDEILTRLDALDAEARAYWSAFGDAEFFAPIGEAWSPAENVRHLSKSIRPVTKALGMLRVVLRVLFGAPRRPSLSYDALVAKYRAALAAGGEAGRFAPSQSASRDRETILRHYAEANKALRGAIERWPDRALDRYQVPHPLLGKLTVREMLMFTLYHQGHHMDGVKRRLAAQAR
jgi:hypothetical protein